MFKNLLFIAYLKTSASKHDCDTHTLLSMHYWYSPFNILSKLHRNTARSSAPAHPIPSTCLVSYGMCFLSMYTWCTCLKGGAVRNMDCRLLTTDTGLSAVQYIVLFVLTVIHQWVFQLWARKSNGPKVIQHKSRATSINNISQAEIGHTIQKWKHVRPWLFHS